MYEFFSQNVQDSYFVAKNEYDIPHTGEFGRLELFNGIAGVEVHEYYCDMREFPANSSVSFNIGGYKDFDRMLQAVADGNLNSACKQIQKLGVPDPLYKISKAKALTSKMSDIEYPMLYELLEKNIDFHLLNPSGGTISRCQEIFKDRVMKIFLTCGDEETYEEYRTIVIERNEAHWPLVVCRFEELPNLTLYGGFTVSKLMADAYSQRKNIFGFEMNPKSFITVYEGEYNYESHADHDFISVDRGKKYRHEERYYFNVPYFRYKHDALKDYFKGKRGYFARTYPFVFNLVSTFKMHFPVEMVRTAYPYLVGYYIDQNNLRSNYDSVVLPINKLAEIAFYKNDIYVVQNLDVDIVSNFKDWVRSNVFFHWYEHIKNFVTHPRKKMCVCTDEKCKSTHKVPEDYCGYISVYLEYDIPHDKKMDYHFQRYLHSRVKFKKKVLIYEFNKKNYTYTRTPPSLSDLQPPYATYGYVNDKWFFMRGFEIWDVPYRPKDGDFPDGVIVHRMVEDDMGVYDGKYVPVLWVGKKLSKWYSYLCNNPRFRYFSCAENIIVKHSEKFENYDII